MEARTLVDLSLVRSEERSSAWTQAVPSLFPGMKVHEISGRLSVGLVKDARLAAGRFWVIDSGPLVVSYSPRQGPANGNYSFSLMLQLEGTTVARQKSKRDSRLGAGALCLIDESAPFQLEIDHGHSNFVFLQFPRSMVVTRYPYFERMTALPIQPDHPGAQILATTLLRTLEADLEPNQQWIALGGLVQFLGLIEKPATYASRRNEWRVQQALSMIETRLSDPQLSVQDIADDQKISRRQLDRTFLNELGITVSARLWERRLARAAYSLQDPARRSSTITEIAVSAGFEDAAHFTRSFKRRYSVPPSRWRQMHS